MFRKWYSIDISTELGIKRSCLKIRILYNSGYEIPCRKWAFPVLAILLSFVSFDTIRQWISICVTNEIAAATMGIRVARSLSR